MAGLAGLVLLLVGSQAWQMMHPPEQAYAKALGALDGTLVQVWPGLPKGTQETLSGTYGRLGLTPPGQRK